VASGFAVASAAVLPGEGVTLWYRVRDLDAARAWYARTLGFREIYADPDGAWVKLERDGTEIALAEGVPEPEGPIAHLDVEDVKEEANRLRAEGVDVGVVLELHGQIRLLEVIDPDGNRIELGQELE
jgi:catechol 2,3-dioxygenase-like lactoylglutathione lyase family enzyme